MHTEPKSRRERAIVIGGSMAGLLAARVLANYFQSVLIIDRDDLSNGGEQRRGVPQGRHAHALLAAGGATIEQLIPGISRQLIEAGAIEADTVGDGTWFFEGGGFRKAASGVSGVLLSRPLLESTIRKRVRSLPNIEIIDGQSVRGLIASEDNSRVLGVQLDEKSIDADLVVDASGRAAPTLAMLDALGWKRPAITEVRVDITYTTAVVNKPVHTPSDWKAVITWPNPPILSLNAFLSPAEDDHWMVTVIDYRQTARLDTWHSFLGALKQMSTPTIYNALCYITPTPKSLQHYSFPASIWRHFERLPRLPKGVLPIGDSLCRFNPIHGQGMSVAAKQARLLRIVLEAATAKSDPLSAISTGFMAQVESVVRTPWVLSTNADLAFPATRGERPENFEESRQYEAALFRAAVADPIIQKALMEVIQLLQPRSLLRDPDIMQRVEAAAAHRVGGKQERSH